MELALSWNRVVALAAPWVAAEDTFERQPAALGGPIARQSGDRIGRAAGIVAAAWRQDFGRAQLPPPGDPDQQARGHPRSFSKARANSCRSSAKSRSIPPARPISTWSDPAMPPAGRNSRASARKRRFIRLRTTAPPIFLVTVKPMRLAGSPSARSRTSRTKPGAEARRPALAARKSARFLSVIRR